MENLKTCKKCGGNACYEQKVNEEITTWLCMGCGFTTSTLMEKGSKVVNDLLETSPELYKDMLFEDKDNNMWTPATITLPGKGMVFIDGTTLDNWEWAAVNAVPLTEEDKASGRFPKEQEVKMDMLNGKKFKKENFMDACEHIGFFNLN
jgi:hypothetical protein|tara:strand:- start:20140 stop:20586 length:447 start_codon:yes stop_codon:yes gene_type:complete